jgi:probable rRNA maturation factor
MSGPITVRRGAGFAWQSPFTCRETAAILAAMREVCGLKATPLEVTLTDDAFISEVNATRLSCPGPTNILSFPPCSGPGSGLGGAPGKGVLLLSLDALCRESFLYGQEPAGYALRLFAHGMAHLAGFDHGEAMDAAQEAAAEAGRRVWLSL